LRRPIASLANAAIIIWMPNRPGSSSPRRRRNQREKDLTSRLFSGDLDEDRLASGQRFSDRNKHAQHSKMERTAGLRADAGVVAADIPPA